MIHRVRVACKGSIVAIHDYFDLKAAELIEEQKAVALALAEQEAEEEKDRLENLASNSDEDEYGNQKGNKTNFLSSKQDKMQLIGGDNGT